MKKISFFALLLAVACSKIVTIPPEPAVDLTKDRTVADTTFHGNTIGVCARKLTVHTQDKSLFTVDSIMFARTKYRCNTSTSYNVFFVDNYPDSTAQLVSYMNFKSNANLQLIISGFVSPGIRDSLVTWDIARIEGSGTALFSDEIFLGYR